MTDLAVMVSTRLHLLSLHSHGMKKRENAKSVTIRNKVPNVKRDLTELTGLLILAESF